MLGSFGEVVFTVSDETVRTWEELSRSGKARFAEHEVLDKKQRLQFVGLDLEAVDLRMKFVAPWSDPLEELGRLRTMRDDGDYHRLMVGGKNFGKYVLEELSEVWNRTDGDGRPLVLVCSLKLREYN